MRIIWLSLCLAAAFGPVVTQADALSDLQTRPDLTPENFIRSFAGFQYELGDRLQSPEEFLKRKRGDCDDFASLAASALNARGYHTKVVVIMMPGATHVVCYVQEAHGILDFNHRADVHPIVDSDGSLEDIAGKTAAYFRLPWNMASEIRYSGKTPIFMASVFPIGAPEKPAKAGVPRSHSFSTQSSVALSASALSARKVLLP